MTPHEMALLMVARLLAGADDDDEEAVSSEGPLCSPALHADIDSVHEDGLLYTTRAKCSATSALIRIDTAVSVILPSP